MMSTTPNSIKSLFKPPHISLSLTFLVLITAFTQLIGSLLYQPVTYWQDPRIINSDLPLKFLFQGGSLFYLGLVILYLLINATLLRLLNNVSGLILACCTFCFHWTILFSSFQSSLYPLFELFTFNSRNILLYSVIIIPLTLFVLLLVFRPPPKINRWLLPIGILFMVGWVLLLSTAVVRLAFPPSSIWHTVSYVHSPGARSGSAIAYDTKRNRAILFGGTSSRSTSVNSYETNTWEWDGQDWQEFHTKIAPPGRYNHAMAFDPIHDKVYLYGGVDRNGVNLSDMWEWDGTAWTRLCPVCSPAGRSKHAMFFDPDRKLTILYGGHGKDTYPEAWSWDGNAWCKLGFTSSNPAFFDDLLTYDSNTKRVISFIGGDWGGTWEWSGEIWSRLDLLIQPPYRSFAAYAHDPATHKTYLFGGDRDGKIFSDTWVFDGQHWAELIPAISPPARSNGVSFFDEVRHSFIIYSGQGFGHYFNDMWEFKLSEGAEP